MPEREPLPIGKPFFRLDPFPLDSMEVWITYEEAMTYVEASPSAVPGMSIKIRNEDGTTYTSYNINEDKTISPVSLGGGVVDYVTLSNQPKINGHVLQGDQTGLDLGLIPETKTYLPNAILTEVGVYVDGDIEGIKQPYDGNEYHVIEANATSPGFEIFIDFENVEEFNKLVAVVRYPFPTTTHKVHIDVFNHVLQTWINLFEHQGLTNYGTYELPIIDSASFNDNGHVRVRFLHVSPGVSAHNYYVDYCSLQLATAGPQGASGKTPVKGVDYMSDIDVQTMVSMTIAQMPIVPVERCFLTTMDTIEGEPLTTTLPTAVFGDTMCTKVFVNGSLEGSHEDVGFTAGGMNVTFAPAKTRTAATIKIFYPSNPQEKPQNPQSVDVEFEIDAPGTFVEKAISMGFLSEGSVVDVNWGDGSAVETLACDSTLSISPNHTYVNAGTYSVSIRENFGQMYYCRFNAQVTKVLSKLVLFEGSAINNIASIAQGQTKSIQFAPGFRFKTPNAITAASCFVSSGVEAIPNDLLHDCKKITSVASFFGTSKIIEIPGDMLNGLDDITTASGFAKSSTTLTKIGAGLFRNKKKITTIGQSFYGCPALATLEEGLVEGCESLTDVNGLFNGCKLLTGIPENTLWGCPSLTTLLNFAPACIALTTLPALLFKDCSNVTVITGLLKGNSGMTSLPGELLTGMNKVKEAASAFQLLVNLVSTGVGFLNPVAESLENAGNMLASCPLLESNINQMMSVPFPKLATTTTMFTANKKMTGSGNDVIALLTLPPTTFSKTFSTCSGLSDFATIPIGWK